MAVVEPTKGYVKAVGKLKDKRRQQAVIDAVTTFIENPKHPGLHFERVKGTPDCWSIRATRGDRIILRRTLEAVGDAAIDENDPATFTEIFHLLDAGGHEIYRRW